jgi:hypothetical protein
VSYLAKAERAARVRKDIERAWNRRRRQTQRRNQRARAAAAPAVVVQVPGQGNGGHGQRQGRIAAGTHHSPELRAAFDRLAELRAREVASHG